VLGCILNETGEDEDISWLEGVVPMREEHKHFATFEDVLKDQRENAEGYVVHFKDNGIRVKVKHDEYKELHRIMTGCTKRTIWERLRNGDGLQDLIDKVPDEMYKWIDDTARELEFQFNTIREEVSFAAEMLIQEGISRKEQALRIKDHPHKGWIFSAIDGNIDRADVKDAIWRSIRPEAETPWSPSNDV
jgi:hypothetical protein